MTYSDSYSRYLILNWDVYMNGVRLFGSKLEEYNELNEMYKGNCIECIKKTKKEVRKRR